MGAPDLFGLDWRDLTLLGSTGVALVGGAFLATRVLRSLRHGFSIRLQLFLAIAFTTVIITGVFGLFLFDEISTRAAELLDLHGVVGGTAEMLREIGPRLSVVVLLLGGAAATSALLLGRGVAQPLERLTHAAEVIASGQRHAVLPAPQGREVRRLTAAFESMRRALEDRHAIEQFVADLSHELKNPVSAIRAACEVLIDEGAADDDEARPRFLRRIDEASKRLEVLLHDLLALARLEARGIEADAGQAVDLEEVVRAALAAHAGRFEARGVEVAARLTAVRVHGSERWLRRAVDNLLANAARYAPPGTAVEVDLRAAEPYAVLTVRDHGPGVEPGIRDRVFERFVTDRADAGGTGLGLAIVRSVAEHHGGDVRLEDPEEGGARFVLRIRIS